MLVHDQINITSLHDNGSNKATDKPFFLCTCVNDLHVGYDNLVEHLNV